MDHDRYGQARRSLSTAVADGGDRSHGTIDKANFDPQVGSEHDTNSLSHAEDGVQSSSIVG